MAGNEARKRGRTGCYFMMSMLSTKGTTMPETGFSLCLMVTFLPLRDTNSNNDKTSTFLMRQAKLIFLDRY